MSEMFATAIFITLEAVLMVIAVAIAGVRVSRRCWEYMIAAPLFVLMAMVFTFVMAPSHIPMAMTLKFVSMWMVPVILGAVTLAIGDRNIREDRIQSVLFFATLILACACAIFVLIWSLLTPI